MPAGQSSSLSMKADGKVSVSGAYCGIASEGKSRDGKTPANSGDISIKAGSMDITSKEYGIFMNGINTVNIDARDGFTLNGGYGISNNSSGAITINLITGIQISKLRRFMVQLLEAAI